MVAGIEKGSITYPSTMQEPSISEIAGSLPLQRNENFLESIREIGELEFPKDREWASWRAGTGAPPFWLTKNDALKIVHGISIENGKKVYRLGRAFLHKTSLGNISLIVGENPILPQLTELEPNCPELHGERIVEYTCGGVVQNCEDEDSRFYGEKVLSLFVNFGDWKTVKVTYSFDEITDPNKDEKDLAYEINEIEGLEHRINPAALITSNGDIMVVAREVKEAAPEGKPDKGRLLKFRVIKANSLVESRLKNNVVVEECEVWSPEGKDSLLEDVRGLTLDDGSVILGLTAVVEEELTQKDIEGINKSIEELKGRKERTSSENSELACLEETLQKGRGEFPYPATAYLESKDQFSELKNVRIIKEFGRGKNMTPIDPETFVFRREGDENNHKFVVLSYKIAKEEPLSQAA